MEINSEVTGSGVRDGCGVDELGITVREGFFISGVKVRLDSSTERQDVSNTKERNKMIRYRFIGPSPVWEI